MCAARKQTNRRRTEAPQRICIATVVVDRRFRSVAYPFESLHSPSSVVCRNVLS